MDRLMLKIKRFGFPLTAIVLFIATADGFFALLNAHFLDLWSWALALALAAVVDAILIAALLEWLRTRGAFALIFMLLFMAVSGAASVNFWYRQIRGSEKTVELFNLQRDQALQEMIALRDRVSEARGGLASLAAHSKQMAEREVAAGDTCERLTAKTTGPRQRFRASDAQFFEGLQEELKPIPPRLDGEIEAVRALKAEPGAALVEAYNRLKLAASNASSVVKDPALTRIANELRRRVEEDMRTRTDGKTTYNCGDPKVRTLAGTALVRIDKLPTLPPIVLQDMSKPGGGLSILPLIFQWRAWGTPAGLSGVDATVVLLALLVELALFWTARGFARTLPPEPDTALEHLDTALSGLTEDVIDLVQALGRDPEPGVRELVDVINRYRIRFLLGEVIIVAQGCQDERSEKLADCVAVFVSIGRARRVRMIPSLVFSIIGWCKWRETRDCARREAYWLDVSAVDGLRLADIKSRLRKPQHDARSSPTQTADEDGATAGPDRRRHLAIVP